MSKSTFRFLILLYVALIVASSLAALLTGGYSQELSDALDNEPAPWLVKNLWVTLAIGLPLAAVAFVAACGLYMLKRWGRTLSLYATVVGLLLWPFSGPSLYSGLVSALVEASTLLWGGILALSYYSNLSAQFSANNAMQATWDLSPK
jgi:hypothetical protein